MDKKENKRKAKTGKNNTVAFRLFDYEHEWIEENFPPGQNWGQVMHTIIGYAKLFLFTGKNHEQIERKTDIQ